ncbi:hypothetical protein LIER_11088 [Lithospermum erythrorhizon]|uniref:Interferon-related developmental regulator N-terminal domain-containing protein n=1 Tax=Lithospermum erythrorhizon TaxID=34254 RepID=A0AAV3PRV8_LITER
MGRPKLFLVSYLINNLWKAKKKNMAMFDDYDTDRQSSSSRSSGSSKGDFDDEFNRLINACMLFMRKVANFYQLFSKFSTGATREMELASLIESLSSNIQRITIERNYATLLHRCLNSIKRGSAKEIALASHVIGLLALTIGPGDKAREILEESISLISEAIRSSFEASKISSLLKCLAVATFVGAEEVEKTEKAMQIMWQVVYPKLGPNVAAPKVSPSISTSAISAWSFLLTTTDKWSLNPKTWQESVSFLSSLLEKDDKSLRIAAGEALYKSLRIAAGEALSLIFEIGSLEKFVSMPKGSNDSFSEENSSRKLVHIEGLKSKVGNQAISFSKEAGGKCSAKKILNDQKNTFRDILAFLENGYGPHRSMKFGSGDSLHTSTWAQLVQLRLQLKHFLGGGFMRHMQENIFLHEVFDFTPKRISSGCIGPRMCGTENRLYKSPNSALSKGRTQFRNKQRSLAQLTVKYIKLEEAKKVIEGVVEAQPRRESHRSPRKRSPRRRPVWDRLQMNPKKKQNLRRSPRREDGRVRRPQEPVHSVEHHGRESVCPDGRSKNVAETSQTQAEIEKFIQRGHLKEFVKRDQESSPKKQRESPRRNNRHRSLIPPRITGRIDTISGALVGGGDNSNSRKQYARRVVYRLAPMVTIDREIIIFSEEELEVIKIPHDDPLIISPVIANFLVAGMLVDMGSSADILYLAAYDRLGLPRNLLKPSCTHLTGYIGHSIYPVGIAELDFTVVDISNPSYNCLNGHPILTALRAIVSPLYLKMKFPTTGE